MSAKQKLRVLLACAVLEFGLLAGAPMRPDEIEDLMRQMNQPRLAHVLPSDEDSGDGPAGEPPADED